MDIASVDSLGNLEGKEVYTIGYPADKNGNSQYKSTGKILNANENVIQTYLSGFKGQSGSGLFLKDTDQLIGILTNAGVSQTNFAPINSRVKEWMEK
ncbi:hypothetical protein MTR00_10815 [Staphylococcus agnetis]|uniref:trypsin-like serine peptidase n=1 Tax=Staphylococcus agnetis TaxID=985762 RepID=UPI00208F8BEC|nr:hypothetical protein [Staphylococcus agnetis]MCO4327851.1 hypothetical protein [Staphylococcus agnetis]MCO4353692.1 hypothetical protein [Staphylococcus agnetis]MCO4370248.1 hypothetical protein [Staphylococcus agnetis]